MAQHHSDARVVAPKSNRHFSLAQTGALPRLAMVVPLIALIWIVLWLLVQS